MARPAERLAALAHGRSTPSEEVAADAALRADAPAHRMIDDGPGRAGPSSHVELDPVRPHAHILPVSPRVRTEEELGYHL